MQVIKKNKYPIFILLIILLSVPAYAQENDDDYEINDTLTVESDSSKTKGKTFFSKIFKRKKQRKKNENKDTLSAPKKKFSFKNLFKRRKKQKDSIPQDSLQSINDSIPQDSVQKDKNLTLFQKEENDSSKNDSAGSAEKPQRITIATWTKMNAEGQDSLLRAWDSYDKEFYIKKYRPSEKERKRMLKAKPNFIDRLIIKRIKKRPYKYRKKLINRQNARYKKTLFFDRFNKSELSPNDTITDRRRYQIVNKRFKRAAKMEAISKNKTVLKYDRKEMRLRRRYALSEKESKVLNKGRAVKLKTYERFIFNRAKRKQEKGSKKLQRLRQKRSIALQNKTMRKKMKRDRKRLARRDKKKNKKQTKKKSNQKHDSSEYPKRYFDD